MCDEPFRDFNARLIPTVDKSRVIGVKTPYIKALARELVRGGAHSEFLRALPHKYFEEDQLHAFIISELRDLDAALLELEHFLPYIDNWATCDQLSVKVFARAPERILPYIDMWLESSHTYTVRFAVCQLMRYFLDDRFDIKYTDAVSNIMSEEYYVNMMCAWFFATALAKQYDLVLPYFRENKLPIWVHNKAIRKARESLRLTQAQKAEISKYRRK